MTRSRDNLERLVAAALTEQAALITPGTLRHPDMPRRPGPLRRWRPAILVAVAVLIAGGGWAIGQHAAQSGTVAVSAAGQASPAGPPPGSPLAISRGRADVLGVRFDVPAGWAGYEMPAPAAARRVCLTAHPPAGAETCPDVTVTIAQAVSTPPLPMQVITSCPDKQITLLYFEQTTIAGQAAQRYQMGCGNRGPWSYFWQLTDQALTVHSTAAVDIHQAQTIVSSINTTQWIRSKNK